MCGHAHLLQYKLQLIQIREVLREDNQLLLPLLTAQQDVLHCPSLGSRPFAYGSSLGIQVISHCQKLLHRLCRNSMTQCPVHAYNALMLLTCIQGLFLGSHVISCSHSRQCIRCCIAYAAPDGEPVSNLHQDRYESTVCRVEAPHKQQHQHPEIMHASTTSKTS